MERFIVEKSGRWGGIYLTQPINGYFNTYYVGYMNEGNPDFLNHLKNTFSRADSSTLWNLINSKEKVVDCLVKDLPEIARTENIARPLCICVPRSKANMSEVQMYFRKAIQDACRKIGMEDGSRVIERVKNTCTTHLRNADVQNNDGPEPYPGITKDTCAIDMAKIRNRNIILIDDIYTKGCNIDEDCIQTLLNAGAQQVIFYAIAYTKRK